VCCRVLSVTLAHSVSADGIAALADLQHLEEFLYHEKDTSIDRKKPIRNQEFFAMCVQLLPRLRISCSRVDIELEFDNFLSDFASKAFRELQFHMPSPLGLRQLALHDALEMPLGVALPDLMSLTLVTPDVTFQLTMSSWLASLTELSLQGVRLQMLEEILTRIGSQLRKLSVLVWDTLFVDRVFRLCPDLRVFYISQFPTYFVGLEAPLPGLSLSHLTEFGFVMQNDECCSCLSTDHLLQILRAAPNLRVFRFKNVLFCDQDDDEISMALEQRSILQNLEKLSCFYEWPEVEIANENMEFMECAYSVIYSIIINCPKLTSVEVDCWA
jgi:hypothetical protein